MHNRLQGCQHHRSAASMRTYLIFEGSFCERNIKGNLLSKAIDLRIVCHMVYAGAGHTEKKQRFLLAWYGNCIQPVSNAASDKKVGTEAEKVKRKTLFHKCTQLTVG